MQPEDAFTIVPVRLEDCGRGDHRLSPYQQYDLHNDFEAELDHLAVHLDGISLADKLTEDTRTEEEKFIESLVGKAIMFLYAGDLSKTLAIFTSITLLKPDDATAWYNKGVALLALGRHDEALAAYDSALKIKPDHAGAWSNKSNVLSDLGRQEEAVAVYDQALDINPEDAVTLANKGLALSLLRNYDEAIVAYEKALIIFEELKSADANLVLESIAKLKAERE